MNKFDTFLEDRNVYEFSGEPLSFQNGYFNIIFQKFVEELNDKIDTKSILVTTAQEIVYAQFSKIFNENVLLKTSEKKKLIEDYYAHCGFGRIDLSSLQSKGGHVRTESEHYGRAWLKHFGSRKKGQLGVSHFTLGFLIGATEAIFDVIPGTFDGRQLCCLTLGDSETIFEIYRGFRKKINHSPEKGICQEKNDGLTTFNQEIINEFQNLCLSGLDSKNGLIEQFDCFWTKQYVNYHSLVAIKLLMQAEKKIGPSGLHQVKNILTQSGRYNAYYTCSKLINSDYWEEYIDRLLGEDKKSLLEAFLNIKTAFGKGNWELSVSNEDEYVFEIYNNPETNAFLKLVGQTKAPLGFMSGGFLQGLVQVIIQGGKTSNEINQEYVVKMAKEGGHISYHQLASRMTGEDSDTIVVKIKPN